MTNFNSAAGGRGYLAIPGPSVIPDAVLRAMHRAAPNIYEGELPDMMPELREGLKSIVGTKHNATIYIANGHGAWEAALANVLTEGDEVLGIFNGIFGVGWGEVATRLGAQVQPLNCGPSTPVTSEALEAALRADTEGKIKAVICTHVDTSTSVRNDIELIRKTMDVVGHDALLMVDCIATLGTETFRMDDWGVDVVVGASQKGLMVSPGLGFVFFNEKAAEVRARMKRVSLYWDWIPRAAPQMFYQCFAGTAPIHHLYGLQAALQMIHGEGLDAVHARHAKLASAIWAACDVWGQKGPLAMNVAERAHRSHAVTTLHIGKEYGVALRRWTEQEAGVTLGIGLGMSTPDDPAGQGFFRIGHMGHINGHMLMGVLGSMEAGFAALNVPRGTGALEAAAAILAG
ncbi:aminotransferase class V-fold PLP-dependent enzyme [Sulfitobacter sp. F26204]|uniref:pyridoxal-phosphate-dependent aminotransferase family protein n=1 Tax=Sulfitobacter sp. F26204 TaxID=2996014 RepID=UPI00225E1109|nr:aminotransferase class V-fold PLP-dependent enzyme [Sulfitobacter sp. F26204]MCX7561002.1 aminotransferase class V-fold PLP-dependent enzyme [Sulfitobacter sp. F26204]